MAYETLANLKAQMNKSNTDQDGVISLTLDAASTAIDNFCNRPDGFRADSNATPRIYRGSGRNWQNIDECTEVTLVAVKDSATDTTYTAWAAGDWIPFSGDPDDADFNSTPFDALLVDPTGDQSWFTGRGGLRDRYFRGSDIPFTSRDLGRSSTARAPTVQVTARWGYADETPEPIREATAMQATRWFKRLEGAMASVLATEDLGTLELFKALDPDVKFILVMGRYVKPAIGRR
jgi:hypothetical protein